MEIIIKVKLLQFQALLPNTQNFYFKLQIKKKKIFIQE